MRISVICLFVLATASCKNHNKAGSGSYWVNMKDSFPVKYAKNFIIDSGIITNYHHYPLVRKRVIDSVSGGVSYLYSWQTNTSGFMGFTTYVDYGEHGGRIIYFIFDHNDSLRAFKDVAHWAGEGGIIYEKKSTLLSTDTLLTTEAASTTWDFRKPAPHPIMEKSKGDSTWFYLIFQKDGTIIEKKLAQKKELNLNP